jgi:NOL1/NOP2/fmu family ribosome biogenesis protein
MESTIQSAPKLVRVAELTYRLEASCSNCMYSILSTDGKLISYSEEANETLRFPQAGIYFIEITQNGYRKVYRIGILN